MTYLRCRNGVFYYRAKLPADLRRVLKRVELSYSLNTRDPHSAAALALELRARQLQLCRAARHAGRMTSDQIDDLIRRYMEEVRDLREDDWISAGELSAEEASARAADLWGHLRDAQDALARNRLEATEHQARQIALNSRVSLSDVDFRRLCLRLLTVNVARAQELVHGLPESPTQPAPSAALEGSPRVSVLVAAYLAHRAATDPMKANTLIEAKAAFKTLVDLLSDPPIREVRNKDALSYAAKVAQLPKRWRQKYKGKSAPEVLLETSEIEQPRIAPATFNKELALVKSFWNWACKHEELERNAMDAVDPKDVGNVKDKRRSFTEDEIRALAPVIERQRNKRPERYWVTLLVAYTGARLEEIAQLRATDVFAVGDMWCLRITDEAGSVKGGAGSPSEREVPIHSVVLARGFLEFVQGSASERLFGSADRKGKFGSPIGKWFGRRLDALCVADRSKKGMHSFRHTMRDKLRLAGVDPVTRREILGHAHEDVEDQVYGDPTGLKERQAAIELVELPL